MCRFGRRFLFCGYATGRAGVSSCCAFPAAAGAAGARAPGRRGAAAPAGPSVLELYYIIIVFRRRLAGSNIFVKFTIFRNDFLVSKIFR